MPGLLRGIARTAVVAGTASAVSGPVQRRQAERFVERDADISAQRQAAYEKQRYQQQAEPPPQPASDTVTQLRQLAELRDQGVLTQEELASQKARILAM